MTSKVFSGILLLLLTVLSGIILQTPLVRRSGLLYEVEAIGNNNCTVIDELRGCEKHVVHPGSGIVYLACSSPEDRLLWAPYFHVLERPARNDYVAFYDPSTSRVTRMVIEGLEDDRGINLHGMDVVPSAEDPFILFVYLVNHRPQPSRNHAQLGADSVIELFKTTVGSDRLVHLHTFYHPEVVLTPNDVSGAADGKSVFFTNDAVSRTDSKARFIQLLFDTASTTVGYCHINTGCHTAATGVQSANGIVQTDDNTIWIASTYGGFVYKFERQADNKMVLVDKVNIGKVLDNLTVDQEGTVYVSAFVKMLKTTKHLKKPYMRAPSSAYRITLNTGRDAYFGEKYKVTKIFEDDGAVASGVTTAAVDLRRGKLYLHGLFAPSFVICPL